MCLHPQHPPMTASALSVHPSTTPPRTTLNPVLHGTVVLRAPLSLLKDPALRTASACPAPQAHLLQPATWRSARRGHPVLLGPASHHRPLRRRMLYASSVLQGTSPTSSTQRTACCGKCAGREMRMCRSLAQCPLIGSALTRHPSRRVYQSGRTRNGKLWVLPLELWG